MPERRETLTTRVDRALAEAFKGRPGGAFGRPKKPAAPPVKTAPTDKERKAQLYAYIQQSQDDWSPEQAEAATQRYAKHGANAHAALGGFWLPTDPDAQAKAARLTVQNFQAAQDILNGTRPEWLKDAAWKLTTDHLTNGPGGDKRVAQAGLCLPVVIRMIEQALTAKPTFRKVFEKAVGRVVGEYTKAHHGMPTPNERLVAFWEFYIRSLTFKAILTGVLSNAVPRPAPEGAWLGLVVTTAHVDPPHRIFVPNKIQTTLLIERRGAAPTVIDLP